MDEAVLRRVARDSGVVITNVYARRGKHSVLSGLSGYNSAARFAKWIVLLDLDSDNDCAPEAVSAHLPNPSPGLCFRFAVREIESWILADRERISSALRVPLRRIPIDPDLLEDPKRTLVEIARRSESREVRIQVVPRVGGSAPVGPLYDSFIIDFVTRSSGGWRPRTASRTSRSLASCVRCIERLAQLNLPVQ